MRTVLRLAATILVAGASSAALAASAVAPSAPAAAKPATPAATPAVKHKACGEACLKAVLDTYLQALKDNDPGRVPVAKTYRYTENGAVIHLGDAEWWKFIDFGKYRQDFYDTESGGVATYVSYTENNLTDTPQPGLMSVRLKVVDGKITEIETILSRGNRNGDALANIDPSWAEAWSREEPVGKRLNRKQLINAAMNYMRSISMLDGKIGNFHPDCQRVENGGITAIAPDGKPVVPLGRGGGGGGGRGAPAPGSGAAVAAAAAAAAAGRGPDAQAVAAAAAAAAAGPPRPPPGPDFTRMGCEKQIDALFVSFIQGFEDAHMDIVDVKRQVVFGTFDFMRRGNIEAYWYPDRNGRRSPGGANANAPGEGLNSEAWKFVDGKIYRVAAVFPAVQGYGRGNGWPGTKPFLRPLKDDAGGRLELYLRPTVKK